MVEGNRYPGHGHREVSYQSLMEAFGEDADAILSYLDKMEPGDLKSSFRGALRAFTENL